MRKVLFTDLDGTVHRTELSFDGNILNPPALVVFRGKLYRHTGTGMWTMCNFYREVDKTFAIVEE